MSEPKNKFVYLFNINSNKLEKIDTNNALLELYYLNYRLPKDTELKKNNIKLTESDIKKIISSDDTQIPLYDAFTSNIYIIQKRNVYTRVIEHDYRFPDKLIIDSIKKSRDKKLKKIEKNPKLKDDKVFLRQIRKTELMIEFMEQLDMKTLYDTYLNIFYKYAPELSNATFTCIRRSFLPHKNHLKPYYSRDEIIKLGMNMEVITLPNDTKYIDYKDSLTDKDYDTICKKIQENDISSEVLIAHQNYIIKNNMVGLVQYYTIQGSYFMNQYMRGMTKYEYRNDYLEDNILKMWKLVLNAPPFDKDYILYRFVSNDSYLSHLKIGDIFIEKGFTSTTRDPFYRTDLYKFGFVLIKIRIPKNTVGVGLSLELLSHFAHEEEIILPPMSHIKLVSRDNTCEYYHPDEDFSSKVKTRYEFEWIKNGKIEFPKRTEYIEKTKTIDFLKIDKIKTMTIKEKIDYLVKRHFDPMNRIKCKIGDNIFYVVAEWYDSSGPYSEMYAFKTSSGFSLYSIYEGYILFMLEIGEINGENQIRINYFTKYSQLNRQKIMGDDNFIHFISSVAYYFDIPNIIIYSDYMSCDKFNVNNGNVLNDKIKSKESDSNDITEKKKNIMSRSLKNKNQRNYSKNDVIEGVYVQESKIENKQTDKLITVIEYDDEDILSGGSFNLDYYNYIKHNTKRYQDTSLHSAELQPLFSYQDLDTLKNTDIMKILRKEDRDEIYQIYVKNYKLENKTDNLADFYIWMIENKCYLMDIFIKKMDRIFKQNNPFKKGMYLLDAMAYLYNRGYVNTYNRFIKLKIDDEHQILTLPKNDYRIIRQ